MKDVLQLILRANDQSMDSESARKGVSDRRNQIFMLYEEQLPNLGENEASIAHRAKNNALEIEMYIIETLKHTCYASEMHEECRQQLLGYRNELTDTQQLLRDIKATVLINRTQLNKKTECS